MLDDTVPPHPPHSFSYKIERSRSTHLPDPPRATKRRNAPVLFNPMVYLIRQHCPLPRSNGARVLACQINIDVPLGTDAEKIKVS